MIVDCHTHWGTVWTERDGDDPAGWLAVLDQHGVDKAFLFGLDNLIRLDLCQADNDRRADPVRHCLAPSRPGRRGRSPALR